MQTKNLCACQKTVLLTEAKTRFSFGNVKKWQFAEYENRRYISYSKLNGINFNVFLLRQTYVCLVRDFSSLCLVNGIASRVEFANHTGTGYSWHSQEGEIWRKSQTSCTLRKWQPLKLSSFG